MFLPRVLFVVFTTWCTVHAITVPIDRADVQLSPTRSSMIANGWRPLATGYENLGTNVSPSMNSDRNNGHHHPVIGKLQEHMHQTMGSVGPDKLKSPTKNHQQQKQQQQQQFQSKSQEYIPPSILGSFSVFGHAESTKSRGKPKEHPKQSTSATTHYSFLIPPPRDSFRFELDPQRKTVLRDNEAFLRQQSFNGLAHQPDVSVSPFFSKGSGFTSSTTNSPGFSKGRPFVINGFNVQHNLRHNQGQQFEVQKASNTKSYLQPPGIESAHGFVKDSQNSDTVNFGRFQNQPHSSQIANGGAGNFYSQVDHPPPFKSNYERDPSFLVHESHEISYVTPPSNFGYNFRPSLPYDNLVPPNLFPSTIPPKVEQSNKFVSQDSTIKGGQSLHHGLPAGTYFIQNEQQRPASNSWPQQKSKFTTEINEVLPRKNPPSKFRQETNNVRPNPIFGTQADVIYIRPNNNQHQQQQQQQQQQQFENPISTGQLHQTTSTEPEYETPESISLKHFNEQQFLLQQQLVQQDRQRLQEQEVQRQREQQRKQEEELRKREEEIRLFEEQEKEAERKKLEDEIRQREEEEKEKAQQRLQEELELRNRHEIEDQKRKEEQLRQQLEEQTKIHEQQFNVQQQEYNRPANGFNHDRKNTQQQVFKPSQEASGSVVTDSDIKRIPENNRQEPQREGEPEVRPYRPKFPQRGPNRRRRPLNPAHVPQTTEASVQDVNTYHSLTDAPPQTTFEPEATTVPVPVTLRPRTRRPGQPLKKRRPYGTTSIPFTESSSVTSSSIIEPETSSRYQNLDSDFSKRRRARPTQATLVTEETVTERHYIRKRPSGHRQRVNPGEPYEAEVVTEIVRPTRIIYKDTTEWENYPESFKKKDSQEIDTSSLPSQTLAFTQDMEQGSTENSGQIYEFSTETFLPEEEEEEEEVTPFAEQIRTNRPTQEVNNDESSNIPLEQLFDKPEENHVEPVTIAEDISTAYPTTTSTTTTSTTTTEIPTTTTTTTEATSTTRQSLRIRPLKYGNSTRPRFSIKDYKSRLDYKNRLSQLSTTEASAVSSSPRRRFTTERPEETSSSGTTSRYKHMNRVSYRSTTSSPVQSTSPDDEDEETVTERVNRFKPRRKFNMNLYRSRVTTAASNGNRNANEDNKQSTTRPENIYSSAIRRPRPSYRNRNQPEVTTTQQEATEMTAEETSFYSAMTTPKLKENREKVNSSDDDEDVDEKAKEIANEVTEGVGLGNGVEVADEEKSRDGISDTPNRKMMKVEEKEQTEDEDHGVNENESIPTLPAFTEPSRDAEDALISQRIANLTSSASELYEPGMFKAVSPATESRVINPHFAIATDEPTLPIEAFFQVLQAKKEK